tara:strand:+ start:466 stop:960 length:495 start_codon:yes stop_codon:yes gene_type:complete
MAESGNIESRVKNILQDLKVEYEWIEVDPDFADTSQFCEKYGFRMEESGNTIIVASKRGEKKFSGCIVLGTDRLDVNKKVKSLMGVSRLSFANAEDTIQLTGMMIGGVTPFALPIELPIYVDHKIMSLEKLIVGGGSRSGKILIHPDELLKISSVQIIQNLSLS